MGLPKGLKITSSILANHTTYQLYDTEIVRFNRIAKEVELQTGGWMTKHTKKCMNLALTGTGYYVMQKGGQWFVGSPQGFIPFQDGIKLAV